MDPRQVIEVNACGPDDPDGERTASLLAAYFRAEQARAIRRATWRWLLPFGAAAAVMETSTHLLSGIAFAGVLVAWLAAAGMTAFVEWRAAQALTSAIADCPGVRTKPLEPRA